MAADETEQGPKSAQDARLTSLEERLKRAGQIEDERRPTVDPHAVVRATGTRLAQNLVGMPIGGLIIGWLIDRWLDSAPWVMLAMMFIGFAGGMLDLMKASKQGSDKDVGK